MTATGFFEMNPNKIENVIKLVSPEGFSIPISTSEVNNPYDTSAA